MNYTKRTKGIGGLATRVLEHSLAFKDRAMVRRLRAIMWGDQGRFAAGFYELFLASIPLAYAIAVMFAAFGLIFATMVHDLAAALAGAVKRWAIEGVGWASEEHGGESER